MAYETIAGAYPSGFTLASAYTGLELTSTATVGGGGVTLAAAGTVHNFGTIAATSAGAAGIDLTHGGRLVNYFSPISGYDGIVSAGPFEGSNYGAITGSHDGVYLTGGGGIQNVDLTHGGMVGIDIIGGAANARNYGTVTGGQTAVSIETGLFLNGSVRYHTEIMSGPNGFVASGAATLINYGSITGKVSVGAGSEVYNGVSSATFGLIQGGVYATGGGVTISNFGTIDEAGGTAVSFSSASDVLAVEAGAVFIGAVKGGGGTLELGAGAGTITDLGGTAAISGAATASAVNGFGSYVIESGGTWTIDGGTIASGQSLVDDGEIEIGGASGAPYVGLVFEAAQTVSGGGTVSLNASGYLSGAVVGDSLDNFDDTIAGGGFIKGPLSLTNGATGVIDANAGRMVLNLAGETVTNDGLIEAAGSNGLLLVRDTTIDGAGGGSIEAAKEIMLDDAAISGGSLTIQAGGRLLTFGGDVAHASTIALGAGTVINAGTLEGGGGGLIVDGDVAGGGLVIAENGSLKITGDVTGAGKMEVFGKGTLEIDGAQGGTIAFGAGATGELVLGDSAAFTGTITGLSRTGLNAIDLEDIDFVDGPTATYAANQNPATGGVLTVSDGTHTARIALRGNYASATFTVKNDGGGGTVVTDPPATARAHAFITAMASFAAVDGPVADKPWLAPASTSLAPVLAQASR